MLYHREVYWPKKISGNLPFGVRKVEYSKHSIQAAASDRYGSIPLFSSINLNNCYIFEAEWIDNKITKIVFRMNVSDGKDVVVAAIPMPGRLYVKTLWYNLASDNHKTLDRGRYVTTKVPGMRVGRF